jgi:Ser/Thr protein kinase RdoA (MazF antagonist)
VELINLIEQNWSLHNVRIEADLKGFDGRMVYHITTDEGEFVAKIRESFYSESEIEKELFIFDFLQSKNFRHAPLLLKCQDGSSFRKMSEGFAYIYHFIKGKQPKPSTDNYRKLSEITALLHQLRGYPYSAKWSTSDVIGHIVSDRSPNLPSKIKGEYLQIAENLSQMKNLPVCPVHGDISLSNSLQTPSSDIVLIDWDGCAINHRVLDIGYPLLQFLSKDLIFDEAAAEAFYAGYFSIQRITNEELSSLFDAALLPALNFIHFGDINENWARIKWLCRHQEWLLKMLGKFRNTNAEI